MTKLVHVMRFLPSKQYSYGFLSETNIKTNFERKSTTNISYDTASLNIQMTNIRTFKMALGYWQLKQCFHFYQSLLSSLVFASATSKSLTDSNNNFSAFSGLTVSISAPTAQCSSINNQNPYKLHYIATTGQHFHTQPSKSIVLH